MSISVICPGCGRPNRVPGTQVSGEARTCAHCERAFHAVPELQYRFRAGAPIRWGRAFGLVLLAGSFLTTAVLGFVYVPALREWLAGLRG